MAVIINAGLKRFKKCSPSNSYEFSWFYFPISKMIILVVVPTVVYCKICAIYLYNCFFKVVFTSGVTDISHLLSHHVYHVHSLT